MRLLSLGCIVLVLAGCGRASEDTAARSGDAPPYALDAPGTAPAAMRAAPGIAVTAAPGVAFNYSYAFRLPAARIAGAQEAHAQMCERLGITRCRITGMRYSLNAKNQISAMLAFKLDPTLARAFGRQGIVAIEAAEGMLTDAEITGTDAGAEIARLNAGREATSEARARIDRELAQKGLTAATRTELLRQRQRLDEQLRNTGTAVAEQQDTLATTPMTYAYESGTAIRGFNPRSPFTEAADTAVASAEFTLSAVLMLLAVLGPPALIALLLFLLWRRFGSRLRRRRVDQV